MGLRSRTETRCALVFWRPQALALASRGMRTRAQLAWSSNPYSPLLPGHQRPWPILLRRARTPTRLGDLVLLVKRDVFSTHVRFVESWAAGFRKEAMERTAEERASRRPGESGRALVPTCLYTNARTQTARVGRFPAVRGERRGRGDRGTRAHGARALGGFRAIERCCSSSNALYAEIAYAAATAGFDVRDVLLAWLDLPATTVAVSLASILRCDDEIRSLDLNVAPHAFPSHAARSAQSLRSALAV